MNSNLRNENAAPSLAPDSVGCCGAPAPTQPEHAWLQRFVGQWNSEIEILTAPGKPPLRSRGVERCRMLGPAWLLCEARNLDMPFECQLTLGFDPARRAYVGTWIDSMSTFLWHYSGSKDASGRTLTLETEGPLPFRPDVMTKVRDVTEFVSDRQRVYTSLLQDARGGWSPMLRIVFRRET